MPSMFDHFVNHSQRMLEKAPSPVVSSFLVEDLRNHEGKTNFKGHLEKNVAIL